MPPHALASPLAPARTFARSLDCPQMRVPLNAVVLGIDEMRELIKGMAAQARREAGLHAHAAHTDGASDVLSASDGAMSHPGVGAGAGAAAAVASAAVAAFAAALLRSLMELRSTHQLVSEASQALERLMTDVLTMQVRQLSRFTSPPRHRRLAIAASPSCPPCRSWRVTASRWHSRAWMRGG